ncbi:MULTISPECIES: acyl-CoA-like ligand-binding transcription factor [Streptomyces]|uniref:acyl-CoA-like ligand-binding transcription factor n=1 Tax=Streptomyces TaxID=1883 RepID=UPI001F22834B|nr:MULTISPECIES: hypothetical protein [Streptomyces]
MYVVVGDCVLRSPLLSAHSRVPGVTFSLPGGVGEEQQRNSCGGARSNWASFSSARAGRLIDGIRFRLRAGVLSRLIFDTPSLHSRYIEKRLRWQAELVPVIRARLGNGPGRPAPDTQAKAIVATVFACVDTATELWAGHDGRIDLADLYDQCLAAVRDHG